jgi:hypothetical protein
MKLVCPYEEKIAGLLNENHPDAEALKHAEHCTRCSDVILAVQALQQGKAAAMQSARLSSPGYLWWKAQLLQKDTALEQISKPVMWVEKFSLIGAICAAIVIALRQRDQVWAFLKNAYKVFGFSRPELMDLFSRIHDGNYILWIALPAGLAAIAIMGGLMLFFPEERS